MRALSVIHFPVFGGPHNLARRLAEPLLAHGWETVVLLPDEPGNAVDLLRAEGVEVITMPLGRLRASSNPVVQLRFGAGVIPQIQEIRRLIVDRRIDVVQIGGLVNPHAALAARLEEVPVVWQLLDTRAPWPVALASMAFVRQLADAVMSTGTLVARGHPGYRAIEDRLVPFFPPVDINLFRPRPEIRSEIRDGWGIPADVPVVGCVANVNPQKGIADLVNAFGEVRNQFGDARLVLVGAEYATHADYSAQVRRAVEGAGLAEGRDVIFTGARFDHHLQLAGFDVFAFAPVSRGEGITTAVLEAMSSGLPVVTTAVAGLPEAIDDQVTGRLVEPGDTRKMSEAIVSLLSDRPGAAALGHAARAHAMEHFATSRCVDRHLLAYDVALRRHGHAPELDVPIAARPGRGGQVVSVAAAPAPIVVTVPYACPACRTRLRANAESFLCSGCGRAYPVVDGIPLLVVDPALAEHDGLDHEHDATSARDEHKARQAMHFDRVLADEFEITRPHGAPRLYRFLLREKFRRATAPIGPQLIGATALTVCGGSGMEAEFLARAGAHVVASDISLGAARRTQERARRYGLAISSIVADVERLPFGDRSFDLVFVHDGLHHLEAPRAGLTEMARVARRWLSISEPARAIATRVAVALGFALQREEAGNVVARLTPAAVVDTLADYGFEPVLVERYAMYYRHRPGAWFQRLSRPWIFPLFRMAWGLGNRAVGRFGNKMVVVAMRPGRALNEPASSSGILDASPELSK